MGKSRSYRHIYFRFHIAVTIHGHDEPLLAQVFQHNKAVVYIYIYIYIYIYSHEHNNITISSNI